jgi:hypothetical protein
MILTAPLLAGGIFLGSIGITVDTGMPMNCQPVSRS